MTAAPALTTKVVRLERAGALSIGNEPVREPRAGEILVRMAVGGICGSDLHYFHDGGFGSVRVREPIILGHEMSGHVEKLGPGVDGPALGTLVAINPSRPCGNCRFCLLGQPIHCLDMHFLGSAMRMPHEQGGFRERMVVAAERCVPLGANVSAAEAACTEPLSVCLHALNQSGGVAGLRVLVGGSGPIGVLMVAALRHAGALEIVATDTEDHALAVAGRMGATRLVNVATASSALDADKRERGQFDVAFDCSGNQRAIATAIEVLKPRGMLVQVGLAGDATLPLSLLVSKEITLRGSQRFHPEFAWAAELISSGRLDVRPVISHTFELSDADEAFAIAGDRTRATKVQLNLSPSEA
jgi:L-idonate 5-dehydrogenase